MAVRLGYDAPLLAAVAGRLARAVDAGHAAPREAAARSPRSRVGQQFRSPPVVVALAEQQGGAGPAGRPTVTRAAATARTASSQGRPQGLALTNDGFAY